MGAVGHWFDAFNVAEGNDVVAIASIFAGFGTAQTINDFASARGHPVETIFIVFPLSSECTRGERRVLSISLRFPWLS